MSLLSVQLYSVRDAFAADPADTLRRLAAIGFTQVEPYGVVENVEALRAGLLYQRPDRADRPRPADRRRPGRRVRRGGRAGHRPGDRPAGQARAVAGPGRHRRDRRRAQRRREGGGRARRRSRLPQPLVGAGVPDRRPRRVRGVRRPARPGRRAGGRHLLGHRGRRERGRPAGPTSATASRRSTSRTAASPPTPPASFPPVRAKCRSPRCSPPRRPPFAWSSSTPSTATSSKPSPPATPS